MGGGGIVTDDFGQRKEGKRGSGRKGGSTEIRGGGKGKGEGELTGRRATREERGRGRGQGTRNAGEGVRVGRSAGYDHSSGNRDHSYNNAHENGGGTGSGPVGSGADCRSNIHLAASNSKTFAGEAKVGDNCSDHHIARSKTNHDKLHAAGIESGITLPLIHRENTSVGSSGHDGVCGLGGSGSGRCFSATLKRGDQGRETVSACQPQLGYGGALGTLVAGQVDGLRPVDKGVRKSGEIKMPSDREGAKQFVTQELTKLKENVDKAKTSLSKKSAAEGATGSATDSSGTGKGVSEGRDEQDNERSAKEEPFGANKNIHTLNSFRTGSSKKVKYYRNFAGFSN